MLLRAFVATALAVTGVVARNESSEYDYIIVGSGPGGAPLAANLAKAGHSVLLLEAGDDQANNPNISMIYNFNAATNDEKTRWDFWTKHSEDPERELKYKHMTWRKTDGSFYVGLAGVCALPSDEDWDIIVEKTGDASWSAANMRRYWTKLERNAYLPEGTPGHGFDGWLTTTIGDTRWTTTDAPMRAIAEALVVATGGNASDLPALAARDMNALDPDRDQATGVFSLATHADKEARRVGTNTYLKATLADAAKYPLTIQLDTLVTKVLFSEDAEEPTAIGVEYLQGKSLYAADPRHDPASEGKKGRVLANKEVIIAGGAFNSPQILKLSGIGPREELESFGIPVVKDLPGVGERLADNYEGAVLALAARPLTQVPHISVMLKTPTAPKHRNMYAFCTSFSYEGYWPGYPTEYGPEQYECAFAHMNPKSQAGYVRLRSADPRDTPDINLRFFETGADEDLQEMLDGVKILRGAFRAAGEGVNPFEELHPCPGVNSTCSDEEQKEVLKLQAHSHHPTSTCAIGGDDDAMAVLDSKFRVRGVKNLRVVDASAFPVLPGAFPVCPTMMLGEKASPTGEAL